jgi:hypothetical protein
MILPVGDEWRIRTDELNFILERLGNPRKKDGKRLWKIIGYFGQFSSALKASFEYQIRAIPDEITELSQILQRANALFEKHRSLMSFVEDAA